MPITEFATFQINTAITSDPLPTLFKRVQESQSSWSSYPVLFYSDVTRSSSSSTIYLISGWESVAAHQKWIESAENQELLKLFKPYLQITGFSHLTLDFNEFQKGVSSDPEGLLAVKNGQVQCDLGEPLWTGQGYDLEDDSGPLFQFAFYRGAEQATSKDGTLLMKRVPEF
ncbi:hypothetical protein E1B28_011167 [Marasmius oreades]|uniref:ABM domain-containing protein n=1 Tax=Marasmius oreades TaxID=181124 RepID=A0A9P7RTQ1_9AGAR|nr:uncharacterized protein E1B28_011167 [Marasmius oreades]KAG7089487.1 hypothetical protein E1B28_011167 [Marasmius oreades]